MPVAESIIKKIRSDGPMSFRDFMEMALYSPGEGYYTSAKENFGSRGDYYTSPYLGPVLADMIAKQIEEMWLLLDKKAFTIVEYGAGTGLLCSQVMSRLKSNSELYKELNYCIVEKNTCTNPGKELTKNLGAHWYSSSTGIPEITGCILSNELIDNFPVHQVQMEDQLEEVFVDYKQNGFEEVFLPASPALGSYFDEFDIKLPRNYRAEINLDSYGWISEVSTKLKKGFVLTIDYGYDCGELYKPSRNKGTLTCYHHHRTNDNPYTNIGEQDITAHVNFTALQQWGIKNGLKNCGYTDQSRFMIGLGIGAHLRKLETEPPYKNLDDAQRSALLHTLMIDMGKKFKVLIQQKGLDKPMLSGLNFC
jgi:SAM-dependent MidA family methyltransferase